jgi:hypothetical protein
MALIGYARVSLVGQSLEIQQGKLKNCDKLFEEKRSGLICNFRYFTLKLTYLIRATLY